MADKDLPTSTLLFMASYILLQPFSTAVSRWIGCREWISALLAVWGVLAMGHAAVRSRSAFLMLRFAQGAAEAGFIPVATYFMTTLYPKEYLGYRIGMFTGLFSLSNACAGLLAKAIMRLDPDGIHNWQVLYLLEGGVTVAMSFMSFWILPGSARTAWMLSPEEKAHAWHRMNEDSALPENHIEPKSLTLRDFTDAVKDWRKLVLVVCTIFVIVPLWSFFAILPLVIHEFGYRGIAASGMMVPPFIMFVSL
jgi:sugar phosphate permease